MEYAPTPATQYYFIPMNDSHGKPAFGPKNPFRARILEKRWLNAPSSEKKTAFLRFELGPEGPKYESGDLLGVCPRNSTEDLDRFLYLSKLDCGEEVKLPRTENALRLREALAWKLNFQTRPTSAFIKTAARYASNSDERAKLETLALNDDSLAKYACERQVSDVYIEFQSLSIPAQALVFVLPPLNPRLYSIASSPLVYPNEAHIAVAEVYYEDAHGHRKGVASSCLTEVVLEGDTLPVFTAKGKMRLPDDSQDVIMIGPGTGIAPFIAFLQERKARGAKGRNWLFFGHRHEAIDFYFKNEIEAWQSDGLLTKLSLAWSRDGAEKLYVQHLLWENRHEFAEWMDGGASLYLCGEKKHMAADVEATLTRIGVERGNASWLDEIKQSKKMQSDTY